MTDVDEVTLSQKKAPNVGISLLYANRKENDVALIYESCHTGLARAAEPLP